MAATPLYKFLKQKGTSFYCMPESAGDIASAYQNQNYKMFFSKYILLNLPKQNLNAGTNSNVIQWDFEDAFKRSPNATPASTYQDQLVESLRNYVANCGVTIEDSMLNNTEYYYDNTALQTTAEKTFWKWCRNLNLIDFEPANNTDEYFGNLDEFASNNPNDDTYFPEILWKEREVNTYSTVQFYETGYLPFTGKLEVSLQATTNFKVGDKVLFNGISNSTILASIPNINGAQANILYIFPMGATAGQRVVVDLPTNIGAETDTNGSITLVYSKLVQYIGEVQGINNVQEATRSYTEVYVSIPDHTGQTPDILFRTNADVNYKPGSIFPILPSQYQPEIKGAESFDSPIVNTPQNYPGSYYGQFDTVDYTYTTSDGDELRRSGDYFGVTGDVNNPLVDGSNIDGVIVDFDPAHYVKMNIIGKELTSFDQFDALEVNNQPPQDFEFNAILWYYTVEDVAGNQATNLYGISFVDNPDNNPVESEVGLRIPTYRKLVATDTQDGTAYAFSLNLNFNIINDNPQDTYNPNAINALFSFNLFNDAMQRLAQANDSFLTILANQTNLQLQISNLRQLLYTQTDLNTINLKIKNLEDLLKLYQTNQLVSSDTIEVTVDNSSTPPLIKLNSKDSRYYSIVNATTTQMYNVNGAIPLDISVPDRKDFLIHITNDDVTNVDLPDGQKLVALLSRDLDYRQSVEFIIDASDVSTQNKQLDIYVNYLNGNENDPTVETLLVDSIDLPVFYNTSTQNTNSAKNWKIFNFEIDFNQPILLNVGGILNVPLRDNGYLVSNSIKNGDVLKLNDLFIGTSSVVDFSGQYIVDSVGLTNSYINIDISSNANFSTFNNNSLLQLNDPNNFLLSNKSFFSLNKGYKYKITRILENNDSSIEDRYLIDKTVIISNIS